MAEYKSKHTGAQIDAAVDRAKTAVLTVNGTAPDANGNVVVSGGGGSGYILPTASADVKGGVKVGEGLQMDGEVLSVEPYIENYRLLRTVTIDNSDVNLISFDVDDSGKAFSVRNLIVYGVINTSMPTKGARFLFNDANTEAVWFAQYATDGTTRFFTKIQMLKGGELIFSEHTAGANANHWHAIDPRKCVKLPSDVGGQTAFAPITKVRLYLNDSGVWSTGTKLYFYGY